MLSRRSATAVRSSGLMYSIASESSWIVAPVETPTSSGRPSSPRRTLAAAAPTSTTMDGRATRPTERMSHARPHEGALATQADRRRRRRGDRHGKAFPASPPPRGSGGLALDAIATPEMSCRSKVDTPCGATISRLLSPGRRRRCGTGARSTRRLVRRSAVSGGRNGDTERRDEGEGTLFRDARRSRSSPHPAGAVSKCRSRCCASQSGSCGARRPELKLEVRDPARLQQEQRGKPQSAVAEQRATGGGDVAETAVAECDREIHPRGLKASSCAELLEGEPQRHRGGRRR